MDSSIITNTLMQGIINRVKCVECWGGAYKGTLCTIFYVYLKNGSRNKAY